MSAREWLHASVMAHIGERATLDPLRVFDMPPVRASVPYAVVEDPALVDWSTKSWVGREGRLTVAYRDAGERPARLRMLIGRTEDAMESLPTELGEGWRLAQLRLVRSRLRREASDAWSATSEFLVRMYREN